MPRALSLASLRTPPVLGLALVAATSLGPGTPTAGRTAREVHTHALNPAPARQVARPQCPAGWLPDDAVCVRLPNDDEGAPAAESALGSHRDRHGDWVVYDQIPRRPDRPADYDAYRYPVPCTVGCVFSGYDLDRDDADQRRGRRLRHVGHGGIDLVAARGTPVVLVALEHQEQDAEVVYVGPLFGTTVVTRHTIREAGVLRDYLLLFAHLESPAPRLSGHAVGMRLHPGDVIGFVGDTGSTGLVHLHLEARRVREGTDLSHLSPAGLVDNAATVACDPRNVLSQK